MRCQDCRQKEAELTTRWERIKDWLLYKLFSQELSDIKANSFTQAFGDGYKAGWQHHRDFDKAVTNVLDKEVKELEKAKK